MATAKRSILYIPGSNARAIEKARTLEADALILDLEDGVSADKKQEARAIIMKALERGGFGTGEIAVRINGLDSPWYSDDLAFVSDIPCDNVVLPKMENSDSVQQVRDELGTQINFWAMIETPEGVLNAFEIARADSRLNCRVVGTNDLRLEMSLPDTGDRKSLQTSLSLVILAARAAKCSVIDGVFNDISDAQGFIAECLEGRQLGFDGKTVIHPSQIGPANVAFSPTPKDVQEAREIIEAMEIARQEGSAVTTLDGRMIEELHARRARRVLEMADIRNETKE